MLMNHPRTAPAKGRVVIGKDGWAVWQGEMVMDPVKALNADREEDAGALVNEVSVSQQLARRSRHFLHAGHNPERPTPPKRQPRLGQIYG